MGRWTLRTEGCTVPLARDVDSGEWVGHSDVAEFFVDAHNADCDAYEARIAELEAELARVKAESLRVVPTEQHELGHYEVAMAIFIGGATTIYDRYDSDEGQLVRLERWEDAG